MTELRCEGCGVPFAADDMNLKLGVATCRKCQRVFRLGASERPDLPQPPSWEVRHEGADLVLTQSWRAATSYFLVLFATGWNGILIAMAAMVFAAPASSGGAAQPPSGFHFLAVLPHVLVGIAVAYWAAASVLNATTVRVGPSRLDVQHGPLPWFGGGSVGVSAIRQLYVEESNVRVNRRATYNLVWIDGANVGRPLIRYGRSLGEMRWLERQIEDRLHIEDRPVADDVAR